MKIKYTDNFNWMMFYILLIVVIILEINKGYGNSLFVALLSISYVKLNYVDPIMKKLKELEDN